jgi:hypothetical protein
VSEVLFVQEMKVNFLSVSALEDMGYEKMFVDGQVLIHSEGSYTQDAMVRLGIREGILYRVMGQLVVGYVILILWITKEIMSQGPHVVDIEY